MRINRIRFDAPVGTLALYEAGGTLHAVAFPGGEQRSEAGLVRHHPGLVMETAQDGAPMTDRFRAWFAGDLRAFDGLPLHASGTPFQQRVWQALLGIPAGATWTYARLARSIGSPAAVRAVGAANGANPVPIVIPCHRVIASDGRLHGYGGGLERKAWLLAHEAAACGRAPGASRQPGLFRST